MVSTDYSGIAESLSLMLYAFINLHFRLICVGSNPKEHTPHFSAWGQRSSFNLVYYFSICKSLHLCFCYCLHRARIVFPVTGAPSSSSESAMSSIMAPAMLCFCTACLLPSNTPSSLRAYSIKHYKRQVKQSINITFKNKKKSSKKAVQRPRK